MRAIEFLTEYNKRNLVNQLGDKLLAKWKSEGEPFKNAINPTDDVSPADILLWISQYDPTPSGSYVKWLAQLYVKNNRIPTITDIPRRAYNLIARYYELKQSNKLKSSDNDISPIKSLDQLQNIINKYHNYTTSVNQQKKELKNKLYSSGDIEVLYDESDYLIAIPHTEKANCYLGKNTQWCTAATKSENMFDHYNSYGDLYFILDKKNNKRWEFVFEKKEYADEQDNIIDLDAFIKTHKKVIDVILKHFGGLKKASAIDPFNWLKYLKNPTEEEQLNAVKKDGYTIELIKDPSDAVKLAAVRQVGNAIKFIKNPSEQIKLEAVKRTGSAIKYINNPPEKLKLIAVSQDGYAIESIKDPSEQIQIVAAGQTGRAIMYIKNPSEEVQLAAVRQDGATIEFIEKPSEVVQLTAVSNHAIAIRYIIIKGIIPSEIVQLTAVKKVDDVIMHITKANIIPSEEVQLSAVKQNGYHIRLFKQPSEAVQLAAVKENGDAIRFIKNPSEAVKRANPSTR